VIELFDREGREAAFCQDGHSIYLWDGRPAAYITNDEVYAYSGQFIGWTRDGWISDEAGERLLFEFDAVGGPEKPGRQTRTATGPRRTKPVKGAPRPASARPARSLAWSDRSFADLI
jgi:hypothetical protein